MATRLNSSRLDRAAFTLIELLIVIAIIGILAALLIPVGGAIKENAKKRRAATELSQIETAIERYKAKYGFYPPDTPGNPVTNQLYFELIGTTLSNNVYQTLDSSAQIAEATVPAIFGNVRGFMNSTKGGSGDDVQKAQNFLQGLNPSQIYELPPATGVKILVSGVEWPDNQPGGAFPNAPPPPGMHAKNPWRYNSSNPTNNRQSYDLWLDIMVRGKTNRVSNWSKQPQLVP